MQSVAKVRNLVTAFLNIADKQDNPEEIVRGLSQFYDVYSKDKTLKSLLFSKRISLDAKKELLNNIFGSFLHFTVIEFIGFLSAEKSMKLFRKIVQNVDKEYKKRNNIVDVNILSTQKMDNETLKIIKDSIQKKDKKRALISTKIDKTILGGIKLRIGNTIIDSSIINKLNQLKTTLLKSRN